MTPDTQTEGATPRRYAYLTRTIIDLHQRGLLPNIESVDVEPEWGWVTRIQYKNGSVRMTYGNDLGLNSGASSDVVNDKAHCKYYLHRLGVRTPRGSTFLLPWWAQQIEQRIGGIAARSTGDIEAYASGVLGYPVYVKPVHGSQGGGVYKCVDPAELATAVEELNVERHKVLLVEESVRFPDYRLVMLNGELISAYERIPMRVTGDGQSTVQELISALQASFHEAGRDTRIDIQDPRFVGVLTRAGLGLTSVIQGGVTLPLRDISNLSAGGTAVDVTHRVAPGWKALAARIASGLNLVFSGIDIACADLTQDGTDYAVLEVNATPGLDHYASVGVEQEQIVRGLYAQVLNLPL